MFLFVSKMVMIIKCGFIANSTKKISGRRHFSRFNRVVDSVVSVCFILVVYPISFCYATSGKFASVCFEILSNIFFVCFCCSVFFEPFFVVFTLLLFSSINTVFLSISVFSIVCVTLFSVGVSIPFLALATMTLKSARSITSRCKINCWFDLLAMRTSFCYDLVRHLRSFQRMCLEPVAGYTPALGSFYSTKFKSFVNNSF